MNTHPTGGGAYRIDPTTGARVLIDAPTDHRPKAPAPAPAAATPAWPESPSEETAP